MTEAKRDDKQKRPGKTLAEFRQIHDKSYIVPQRLKAALALLGDGWEYEVYFLRTAVVSPADASAFRDKFADHIVIVSREGRRAWVGKKHIAAQMRSMV